MTVCNPLFTEFRQALVYSAKYTNNLKSWPYENWRN